MGQSTDAKLPTEQEKLYAAQEKLYAAQEKLYAAARYVAKSACRFVRSQLSKDDPRKQKKEEILFNLEDATAWCKSSQREAGAVSKAKDRGVEDNELLMAYSLFDHAVIEILKHKEQIAKPLEVSEPSVVSRASTTQSAAQQEQDPLASLFASLPQMADLQALEQKAKSEIPKKPKREIPKEEQIAFLKILDLIAEHSEFVFEYGKQFENLLGAPFFTIRNKTTWLARDIVNGETSKRFFFDKTDNEEILGAKKSDGTRAKYDSYYEIPDKALAVGCVIQFADDRGNKKNREYGVFLGMTPEKYNPPNPDDNDTGGFAYVKFNVNKTYQGDYQTALLDATNLARSFHSLFKKQKILTDLYLGFLAPIPSDLEFLKESDPDYLIDALLDVPTYKYAINRKKRQKEHEENLKSADEPRTDNPKRKITNWQDSRYPFLPLQAIDALEPLANALGVSEVARGVSPSGHGDRGFLVAFRSFGGDPSKLVLASRMEGKDPNYWINKREDFNTRHLAQIRRNKRSLWMEWRGRVVPSRQHLALAMWAYSPDAAKLMQWIKANEGFLRSL